MLGGGIFVTQNKELPGSYINFVSSRTVSNNDVGERGTVAIVYPLTVSDTAGKVVTVTKAEFATNSKELLGAEYSDASMLVFREIFRHASKIHVFNSKNVSENVTSTALNALETYQFDVLAAYTATKDDITEYTSRIKTWREDYGKKCQVVVYNTDKCDYEGVVNVVNTVTDSGADAHALVAWVAGALAGAQSYESCTNMLYDGEYDISTPDTQSELIAHLKAGDFAFHLVYDEVRVLEDINTLVTYTTEKSEDFKYNQTIRVLDQIANDIARIFNQSYLGKVPNDASGRASFAGRVVAHHKTLETLRAIEDFDAESVTVTQGDSKKAIVVEDTVKPVSAMSQLYMTVYVE